MTNIIASYILIKGIGKVVNAVLIHQLSNNRGCIKYVYEKCCFSILFLGQDFVESRDDPSLNLNLYKKDN